MGETSRRDPGKARSSFLPTLRAQRHRSGISTTDVGHGDVMRNHSSESEMLRRNQGCRCLKVNKRIDQKMRITLSSPRVILCLGSFCSIRFNKLMTVKPSKHLFFGCRPPVEIESAPIVSSAGQSSVQILWYNVYSLWLMSEILNGVWPNRRQ